MVMVMMMMIMLRVMMIKGCEDGYDSGMSICS